VAQRVGWGHGGILQKKPAAAAIKSKPEPR
jgi:hypothetical protein